MLNITLTSYSARGHFTPIDYAIFILLILVSLVIGTLVGLKGWNKVTTKDFLTGGRNMHPIPVSMSLIGGVISAISVLGNATETYLYGTQLWLNVIGCFWGTIVVMFLILPTLYPLELVSMMQYLEIRFKSVLLKKLGSIAQMINMGLFLGICLYAPSLALSSVTSLPTWASIVVLGLVCTVYISIGGVKAVVYTDVVQTTIMFFGIAGVIIVVCLDLGGVSNVLEIASEGNRLEFFNFDTSLMVRHTFWSVQALGLYFVVSVVGISQPQFQRLNSVKTLRSSQGLCVLFYFGLLILWSLFYFTGIVAYATYADCDPLASGQIQKADQIVPFLVADKLKGFPGMAGLFVAAVYGAVLSSVSSTASAFAALIWEDFLRDWQWFRKTITTSPTNVTRILTAVAGLMGIGLAFIVGSLGTLFQAAYSISGAVIGPLDGLFITAISAPWVTEKGAICGFISAFAFNIWLVSGQLINGAGKEAPLPTSINGCHEEILFNLANMTSQITTQIPAEIVLAEEPATSTQNPFDELFPQKNVNESDYLAIFDVSYCYFGTFGILLVFIISSIVSLILGPNNPRDIDENLVHKPCLKVYKYLWGVCHRNKKVNIEIIKEINPNEVENEKKKYSYELEPIVKYKCKNSFTTIS